MKAILLCLTAVTLLQGFIKAQLQDPSFPWVTDDASESTFLQTHEAGQAEKAAASKVHLAGERSVINSKRLSLHINPDTKSSAALPQWCKPTSDRSPGPWHLLSDDEYTNESPYLLCGLPGKALRAAQSQRTSHRRAAHGQTKVSSRSRKCSEVLMVPKVAMMFLTQGPMPHEALWERWLASIAGLMPTLCLANAVCTRGGLPALANITDACGQEALQGNSTYDQQLLFSVYIHAPPEYPLRNRSSVFYGRDSLVARLTTKWADHSTVEAMRRMMQAALRDKSNQRFILLSESCIPLYSPLIVYQQLMHEKRSRISACANPGWERSLERYNIRMAAGRRENGKIPTDKWRKHMHWFSLTRFHAEIVANDTDVVETFARDCFTGYDELCTDPSKWRFCLADEHYVSTLLAVYGLDAQTDCMGHLTNADFSDQEEHPEHPKQYTPDDVNAYLIRKLRGADAEAYAATQLAQESFHTMEEYGKNASIWNIPYPQIRQLAPHFYLFARKFGADTAEKVLTLYEDRPESGEKLGIFGGALDAPVLKTNMKSLMKGQ